jgi:uncharacterized heparinase superfamily protein
VVKQMAIKRYFHTVRYLEPSQIYWRLYYKVFTKSKIDHRPAPWLRSCTGAWAKPITKKIKMLGERKFRFLNTTHELQQSSDWNSSSFTKLWLYNLHYFDDLNCKDPDSRTEWHQDLIKSWIDENPPGLGNGWEPYPISLRVVNWIKWSLSGNKLDANIRNSLAVQIRYLMKRLEFHLLGNHLFANAKALIYAGLFFKGNEADLWFKKGVSILEKQLPEQILSDGGNFELSTMYHAIFLEDLLDIINIYGCYELKVPNEFAKAVTLMLSWLTTMTHPNGELSFFNDTANGISSTTDELENYCRKLNLKINVPQKNVHLAESGYFRIEQEDIVAILDIAAVGPDYIPGHAHADTLSFECSIFKQKVIVNSGTSLYGVSEERLRQRATKAHSTLAIDDENSSEVWSGFRVARRARVFDTSIKQRERFVSVVASHDGYYRLQGKPQHCRQWNCAENYMEVIDSVTGTGKHKIEVLYHLAPEVIITDKGLDFLKLSVNKHIIIMKFKGEGKIIIAPSTYHPEFGLSLENMRVIWLQDDCELPFNCKMTLSW